MSYEVKRVNTWDALWKVFSDHPTAYPIAGGTDIIPRVNQGIEHHDLFVLLDPLPGMHGISIDSGGTLTIGALTKLVEITEAEELQFFVALQEACSRVASPQIRNQATIGGNVLQENRCVYFNQSVSWRREEPCFKLGGNRCYQYQGSPECVALFQSDVAPVLMSYGALAVWASPEGERISPLSELYLPAGRKNKASNEILVALKLPAEDSELHSAYVRQTVRKSFDFPLISCAVALHVQNGLIQKAGIALGSAGVMPKLALDAGNLLIGKSLTQVSEVIEQVETLASKQIMPFRDSRIDGPTRKTLGKDAIHQALLKACCIDI